MAGKRGHVSIIDQHSLALKTEFFVNETVRDACFLHNGTMAAVAQEKNVFIYDDNGVEIHRLDGHKRVGGMEFLPYHWLLGEFLFFIIFDVKCIICYAIFSLLCISEGNQCRVFSASLGRNCYSFFQFSFLDF